MDLILIARCLLAQLAVYAHQFALGGYQLVGDRAGPCLAAQEHAGNGHCIEPIRFGSQSLTLVKLMRLSGM